MTHEQRLALHLRPTFLLARDAKCSLATKMADAGGQTILLGVLAFFVSPSSSGLHQYRALL